MTRYEVQPSPCSSCPYRRDTEPGIWAPKEYRKLRTYAEHPRRLVPNLAAFLCHLAPAAQRPNLLCRGWLSVECHSIAVRILLVREAITPEEVFADVDVPLYETGAEACAAGLAGVENPSPAAIAKAESIVGVRRRRRRLGEQGGKDAG